MGNHFNTEAEELKHRLEMIAEDLRIIRAFIYEKGLEKEFEKPTGMADECWTHLNNIEIACDVTSEESLDWSSFGI